MSLHKDIEKLINSVLQLDEESFEKLAELDGKLVGIKISGLDYCVYLKITSSGILLTTGSLEQVDVSIQASTITYLSMIITGHKNRIANVGNMEIVGDVNLAQKLQSILVSLDIDWEEYISRWVGDYPAHKIGNAFRGVKDYFKNSRELMGINISEYLRYEKEILPEQEDIENFNTAVDKIRYDAERLAQRLKRLDHKLHIIN